MCVPQLILTVFHNWFHHGEFSVYDEIRFVMKLST